METSPDFPDPHAHDATALLRRFFAHRAVWHTAGLIVALAVTWLLFRAYRQPDFIIDFMNLRFC